MSFVLQCDHIHFLQITDVIEQFEKLTLIHRRKSKFREVQVYGVYRSPVEREGVPNEALFEMSNLLSTADLDPTISRTKQPSNK